MLRKKSGYSQAGGSASGYTRIGSSSRSPVTRRALLGAVALVTGAGIADLLHRPSHRTLIGADERIHLTGDPKLATNQSRPLPGTRSSARPSHGSGSHGNASTHSGSAHPHGHTHHGHGGGGAHSEKRHHSKKAEHVSLPAYKVPVRHHPVFYIDDLIKHAPKHAIALTIDDGPDPEWTPKVLRLLDKYHMQASFCVIGMHAESYPKLVRDVHRAGHILVNHSYTHVQPFQDQTEKRVVAEITRAQRAIERATGFSPELFRAPGGAWNPFIFRAVAAYGLIPLDWDVDPRDWARPGTKAIERSMLAGRPGDIVLCHDGGGDRGETVRALRKVLPTWKHKGYTTIPLIPDKPHVPPSHSQVSASPTASASSSTTPGSPGITPTP